MSHRPIQVETAIAAACLLAMGLPALAQEDAAGLEEVVVTAERREANLQETPVTLTALSGDQISDLGITTTLDLAKTVPNLQLLPLSASPSTFMIGLRGGVEQVGGLIVSEPVVGLYIDDVYRGRLQGSNVQLLDVERIEVLRGPQGTLYGRNTFSGAIKIVTRTPSADRQWAEGSVGAGSFGEWNAKASVGGGLTDSLGASLSVLYRDQSEGWIFNRAQNRKLGREENLALRGKLAWESGPISASLTLGYSNDENDGYIPVAIRFEPFRVPTNLATSVTTDNVRPRFGNDPYVAEYPQPSKGDSTTTDVTLNVAREFDGFTLRSISGYVELDDYWRWDLAAGLSPSPGVYLPSFDRQSDATADQFTQELQALGQAFGGRFDWITGLYYFSESGSQMLTDDIPLFGLSNLAPTILTMDTKSWAVFGQGTWRVSDKASLTIGGRYTSDDKSFSGDLQTGFGNPVPRTQVSLSETWSSFTPKLGLDYKFNEDLFGYFTASKGSKAGGFNGLAVLNAAVLRAVFGPQDVVTYEAGLKAEWLGRRLRTNVAYFMNDITDLQQTASIGVGSFAQQNIGDATVQGIEAEIVAEPLDGLNLFATLGWMDGEYDQISPSSQAAAAGAKYLPLVTDITWQIGFNFERPIGSGLVMRLGADAHMVGDNWVEATNSVEIKAYTRYDAFVALGADDGKWELSVQGKNLSDEVNFVNGFVSSSNPGMTVLRPRTWMASVRFKL